MQNAKDTFFELLCERVSAADPALTVVLRGAVRTAVVVEENELPDSLPAKDLFRLRWTELAVDAAGPLPVVRMRGEISYATAGKGSGMDRGRALIRMDQLLLEALHTAPQRAQKRDFNALAQGGAVTNRDSWIWWSDVTWNPEKVAEGLVERVATVDVWSVADEEEA